MPSVPERSALRVVRAVATDLAAIETLAREIWCRVYPGIISLGQIEYMLERMYRPAVVEREMAAESIVYLKILIDEAMKGFAAFGPGDARGEVLLHKLYLHPEVHGMGYGSAALTEVESEAALEHKAARRITLRVNKQNQKAIRAYTRNGYRITGEVCSDIGGGFVMDDYRMQKEFGDERGALTEGTAG